MECFFMKFIILVNNTFNFYKFKTVQMSKVKFKHSNLRVISFFIISFWQLCEFTFQPSTLAT